MRRVLDQIQTEEKNGVLLIVQPIKLIQFSSIFFGLIFLTFPLFNNGVPSDFVDREDLFDDLIISGVIFLLTVISRLLFVILKHKFQGLLKLEFILEYAEIFYVYIISFGLAYIFTIYFNNLEGLLGFVPFVVGMLVNTIRNVIIIDKNNLTISYSLHYIYRFLKFTQRIHSDLDHLHFSTWLDDEGYSGYQIRLIYKDDRYLILDSGTEFRNWLTQMVAIIADFLDISATLEERDDWGSSTRELKYSVNDM